MKRHDLLARISREIRGNIAHGQPARDQAGLQCTRSSKSESSFSSRITFTGIMTDVDSYGNREHLYRHHALPIQCPRCWISFGTDVLRDIHLQAEKPCEKRENEMRLVGFTKSQMKQLKSETLDPRMTDEKKWREIYTVLFPDDDPAAMPDPRMSWTSKH